MIKQVMNYRDCTFLLICCLSLQSCTKLIEAIPQTAPVRLSYPVNESGLTAFKSKGVFGPGKMEVSLSVVLVNNERIHRFADRGTIMSGEIEIFQTSCDKSITIAIPEKYFNSRTRRSIKTINPCGFNKVSNFEVDLSNVNLHQSNALSNVLINESYSSLNVYPPISNPDEVKTQLEVRFHPKPSSFY